MKTILKRLLPAGLIAGALAVLLAPAQGAAAAATLVVSHSSGGCGSYHGADYEEIYQAVDALPASGGTIVVCPDDFKSFSVDDMAGKVTIKAAMPGEENMLVIKPTLNAGGGTVIYILNSKSVTLDGLVIDGHDFGTLGGSAYGVRYQNSSGAVQNSAIIWQRNNTFGSTANHGYGIWADFFTPGKTGTLTIKNNVLRDIETVPVHVEGQLKATISDNYMLPSSTSAEANQSGIEIYSGASAAITKNVINNAYTGIFLYGALKSSLTGNIISRATIGIDIYSACFAHQDLTKTNKISGNTLTYVAGGIRLYSNGAGGCQPHTDANTISANIIGGQGPAAGTGVWIEQYNGGTVTGNKVTGNTIISFMTATDPGGSSGNTFTSNISLP